MLEVLALALREAAATGDAWARARAFARVAVAFTLMG